MTKNLLIQIQCGEETCQSSVYQGCGHVRRKPLSNDFYCGLFHANLEGKHKQNPGHSYFETKRCELCKTAEQK